jgi:uncharacterized phiE125 gp8 family phage protein
MPFPVSIEEARRQLRLESDDTSRDDDLKDWIEDAAGWVEGYTKHLLTEREVVEHVAGFKPVTLTAWPIAATALPALAYLDADGSPIGIANARLDVTRRPARIFPATGLFWPFRNAAQPFTVTITAGYPTADEVPRDMKRAMLILITAYDEDREGGDLFLKAVKAAERLCGRFRLRRL